MTQRSYAWSAPSLTRNRALPNTLSLEPTLSQQIRPIDVLLKEASPTLLGHFSAFYSSDSLHYTLECRLNTTQSYRPRTVLQSTSCLPTSLEILQEQSLL